MQLFPDLDQSTFATHFTNEFVGPEYLSSNEGLLAQNFSGKRLSHFCTGRYAAKEGFKKLGKEISEILMGSDGDPKWPSGYSGSISHSDQLVGAIVTNDPKIASVGLDIEKIGRVKRAMWDMCFTLDEQAFLQLKIASEIDYYTTLYFSLKESFYKMQYPITKKKIWFTDVEIEYESNEHRLVVSRKSHKIQNNLKSAKFSFSKYSDSVVSICLLSY